MVTWGEYYAIPSVMTPGTISLSRFEFFQLIELTKLVDSRIKNTFRVNITSDTRILVLGYETNLISDSRIKVIDNQFTKLSDSRVLDTFKVTALSDSRILDTFSTTKTSDSTIFHPEWGNIEKFSDSRVKIIDNNLPPLPSDSLINRIGEIIRISDTVIDHPDWGDIQKTSDSAVKRIGYDTKEKLSDSRVKVDGFDAKEIFSLTSVKLVEDNELTSDTAIFKAHLITNILSDSIIIEEGVSFLNVFSDSHILTENDIAKLSDTFVILNQDITKLSDSAIFRNAYNTIETLSDSAIFVADYGDMQILSDSAIFNEQKVTNLSDSRIKREAWRYPNQNIEKSSDTNITKTPKINVSGYSRIKTTSELTNLVDTLITDTFDKQFTSDTNIFKSIIYDLNSNSRILTTNELTTLSDSAIYRSAYNDLQTLSDTHIDREPIIDLDSNTRIRDIFEITPLSDTYMVHKGTKISISSDTAIFRAGYETIEKYSDSVIQKLARDKALSSDSRAKVTQSFTKTSSTQIKRYYRNAVVRFQKSR